MCIEGARGAVVRNLDLILSSAPGGGVTFCLDPRPRVPSRPQGVWARESMRGTVSWSLPGSARQLRPRTSSPAAALQPRHRNKPTHRDGYGPRQAYRDGAVVPGCVRGAAQLTAGFASLAESIDLWSQHQGQWVKWQHGAPFETALHRMQTLSTHVGIRNLSSRYDNDRGGDAELLGTDWYAGREYGRISRSHQSNDAEGMKNAARTMIALLDALARQKQQNQAQVIINSVGLHSRLAESLHVDGFAACARGHLSPRGSANGTTQSSASMHEDGHHANGQANGLASKHSLCTPAEAASNGVNGALGAHCDERTNGHETRAEPDGGMLPGPADMQELSRLFDEALVVHRGKPGLEERRPNPYSGSTLPEELARHLISANLKWTEQQSILTKPIDESKLPAFYADLLDTWRRAGLVVVAGPQTREEAENDSARAVSSYHQPQWKRYSTAEELRGVDELLSNVVSNPLWGSGLMARQLYSEQRGIDIGVATYMRQKAGTEMRGSGSRRAEGSWRPVGRSTGRAQAPAVR